MGSQNKANWAQGYTDSEIHYIDKDVVCFRCGKNVKFVDETGFETVFPFHGDGHGPFTAHSVQKHFAVAEQCLNPKIFIFEYPYFKKIQNLEGGAQLEFQQLIFSASEYLLSISGLPDFEMILWKYETGVRLASVNLKCGPLTSVSFNPGNWRQICVTTEKEITVWQTEQANNEYILLPQTMKTPPDDPMVMEEEREHETLTRASSTMTRYTIDVPMSAKAGLVGETALELSELWDVIQRVIPVSQAWTPTGDVYIGCKKGHLLKVDTELWKARVLYYPMRAPDSPGSRITSAGQSKTSLADIEPVVDDLSSMVLEGALDCLVLHKKGLYAVGSEGVLRKIETTGDDFKVTEQCILNQPIAAMAFNHNYSKVVLSSSMGRMYMYETGEQDSLSLFLDFYHGNFVGVTALANGTDAFASVRENGEFQVWNINNGKLKSSISLGSEATCITGSPACHVALVGTTSGHIFSVDLTDLEKPRIVQRFRIYGSAVTFLQFDEFGKFLITAPDGNKVYVSDGRQSTKFKPLGYTTVDGTIEAISVFCKEDTVKVAVTSCSGSETDLGSNMLMYFKLTDKIISDLKACYNSLKCDFKDEVIEKVQMSLTTPTHGIALGEDNIVYGVNQKNKRICSMRLPDKRPRRDVSSDWVLNVEAEFPGHQLPGASVMLSPHSKWLVSYGKDGCIMIRALGSMDRIVSIQPHEYTMDGIRIVAFSEECRYVVSAGYDGVLNCFKWNYTTVGEQKSKSATDIAEARSRRLKQTLISEDEYLKHLPEWNTPEGLSRSTSSMQREHTELIEKNKQESIEKDVIYQTPTPTAKPDATWQEERELEAHIDEDRKYSETKTTLRTQIRDIRRSIQEMIAENDSRQEIEKLGRHEFDLDVEEQNKLQALGEAEVARVREEIEFDNLAKMYLREMIKKECWDDMKVKGRSLQAFNSSLEVANFPMKERTEQELKELETISRRRRIEIAELPIRKHEVEHGHRQRKEDDLTEGEEEEDAKELPSTTGSLGAQCGGESDLFYSQFELHSREQKMSQIVLLQDAIVRIKLLFNKEFDEVFSKKEQEIGKIKDKNKRIKKIMDDLDTVEEMMECEMGVLEKTEMLLTVDDSEVKVEKYLTAEQRKHLEEVKKAEEERIAREKGDNARDRALDMMMGGVLEIKKEDELKKDIPKPQFMVSKAEDDWSEDEKKLVADYIKKVQDLQEERDKYRKQLETELRKLQSVIQEAMASYDDTLNGLFHKKIKVMMVTFQEELKILRLRYALLKGEELELRERELVRQQHHKKQIKHLTNEAANEASKHLLNFKEEYDILVAEDKVLDRSFKREFSDVSPVMQDHLYKLFKKRPRGHKFKGAETPLIDHNSMNPFAERPSTARQTAQAKSAIESSLDDMDRDSNMPEGLDPNVWKRMCAYRREKINSEQLVKTKSLIYAEMTDFEQKRKNEDTTVDEEIRDLEKQIKTLREDRHRFTINLEVQLLLKQGQVEVDSGVFVHDYTNSVLIHRTNVEELNQTIKQLGESKITSMVESKDFRKGIIQLEWEHKRMLMQMSDLQKKMKEIQYMKVTREIQAFLYEANYDAKKQQEIVILEQTILLQKTHHAKHLKDKKRTFKDLEHTISQKDRDNSNLDSDLTEFNVCVHERKHIDMVNADRRMDTGAEKRYQEIVQRRKLVDLAKAQAQEVAVLRAEVERLRMRTFPALVQVEH